MQVLFSLIYIVVLVVEIIPLYKQNKHKETVVYAIFIGVSYVITLLLSFGVEIPSVNLLVEKIVMSITQ